MTPLLASILRKATIMQNCGQPRPDWLAKQVEAIHECNLYMLIEALQDEIDCLDKAVYTPYPWTF